MDLNFRLKPWVWKSGEIYREPSIIFDNKLLNKTLLDMFLKESDDDYSQKGLFNIFDNYTNLTANERIWNTDWWYIEVSENGMATITDMNEGEEDYSEGDLYPSVTLPVPKLKELLLEYRKQAQAFRDKLPEMQKQENERRFLDENTFGF